MKTQPKLSTISDDLRELVYRAVTAANQPVTVYEVLAFIEKNTGRAPFHDTIRKALRDLVAQGRLFSRAETMPERHNRQGSNSLQGQYALLYWYKPTIIERISKEAFPGISNVRASDYTASKRSVMRNALAGMDGAAPKLQTGNRIDRLEREVKALREVVANLIKAIG